MVKQQKNAHEIVVSFRAFFFSITLHSYKFVGSDNLLIQLSTE